MNNKKKLGLWMYLIGNIIMISILIITTIILSNIWLTLSLGIAWNLIIHGVNISVDN